MAHPTFLLSHPGPDWQIRGGVNFRSADRRPTNPREALHEWIRLADAITELGGQVVVMPPQKTDPPLTGLIYAANHGALFTGVGEDCFVVARMHVEHRRAEADPIGRFVAEEMGLAVEHAEHTWEGQADICTLSPTHLVLTFGVRTVREACDDVRARLPKGVATLDAKLRDPWFHGDTCLSPLVAGDGHGVLLAFPGALVDRSLDDLSAFAPDEEVVPITEADALAYACNALQVNDTVLMPQGVSDALVQQLEDRGMRVQVLGFDELFGKGGGGPRCLVNVLRGLDPATLPREVTFGHQREAILELAGQYPESI